MKKISEILEKILKEKKEYISEDGSLLKTKIYEDVMQMKEELIELLMNELDLRKAFFVKIKDIYVFDKQKFISFLEAKEFLPDSYTVFKNKIGLTDKRGNYLSDSNDVVLSFPYKDCVLAGGQTKEDQKREEIVYNEVLGYDEISRMLAPKVFTNAKRYSKDGIEENIEFTDNDNLVIKGNNLIALSSLLERFEGKIKCIYIDPPYNTGSDSFGYNDKFNRSTWLLFMKNRLELAKKLLSEKGVILVQCDKNQEAYLKVLMDEIFREEKYINSISVRMSSESGNKMAHASKTIPKVRETIHVYKKGELIEIVPVKIPKTKFDDEYSKIITNLTKEEIQILKSSLEKKDVIKLEELLKKAEFSSISKEVPNATEKWKFENAYRIFNDKMNFSLSKYYQNNPQYKDFTYIKSASGELKLVKNNVDIKTGSERLEIIFADTTLTYNPCDMWTDMAVISSKEGQVELKGGKKPEKLIKRILEMFTKENETVLDFYFGTGTTGAVAHKLNRRYIGIEQLDYIEEKAVYRLKKVIEGDKGGISKEIGWQGGGSFVYCELKEDSISLISKIQTSTEETILGIKEEIFNDDRIIPYISKNELKMANDEFERLSFEDKKDILIRLVDKNKLYVNYSEINDERYNISEEEKKFTNSFYKEVE